MCVSWGRTLNILPYDSLLIACGYDKLEKKRKVNYPGLTGGKRQNTRSWSCEWVGIPYTFALSNYRFFLSTRPVLLFEKRPSRRHKSGAE